MTNQQTTIKLTNEIFTNAVLMSVSLGYWSGEVSQDEADLALQGLGDKAKKVFKPGHKMLVDPKYVKVFAHYRSKINYFLELYSYAFPLRGVRFIPKTNIKLVLDKLDELEEEFSHEAEEFCNRLETMKTEMQAEFPELWANLKDHYPSKEDLRKRFYIDRSVFTWDQAKINEIAAREGERFEKATRDFMEDAMKQFRSATLKAATNFKSALETEGKVDNRSLESFKSFVDRFKGLNFFGDQKLDKLIESIKTHLMDEGSWVDDGKDKDVKAIRQEMSKIADEIARTASEEGEAEATLKGYMRHISPDLVRQAPGEESQDEKPEAAQLSRPISAD
jgi:hypothetical protein